MTDFFVVTKSFSQIGGLYFGRLPLLHFYVSRLRFYSVSLVIIMSSIGDTLGC